jgi:nucleotide-binding universal stress UspA family protein
MVEPCAEFGGIAVKTILIAVDGSKGADKALELGLDLAKQHRAEVKLLHVLLREKEPAELLRLTDLADAAPTILKELERLAHRPATERTAKEVMTDPNAPARPVPESLLRKIGVHLLKRSRSRAGRRRVRAETLEIADGSAAPAIVRAAAAAGADAIVMGSRGLSLIDALGFGSTSQEVCRTAHCTCVAVH